MSTHSRSATIFDTGLAMKTNTDVKMVAQKTRNPDFAVARSPFLCFVSLSKKIV